MFSFIFFSLSFMYVYIDLSFSVCLRVCICALVFKYLVNSNCATLTKDLLNDFFNGPNGPNQPNPITEQHNTT